MVSLLTQSSYFVTYYLMEKIKRDGNFSFSTASLVFLPNTTGFLGMCPSLLIARDSLSAMNRQDNLLVVFFDNR